MRIARVLAAAALAVIWTFPVAVAAQQGNTGTGQAEQAQAEPDASLADIGRAVYTSDGEHVGEIVHVATYGDRPALRAEIGRFLGLGTTTAIIPAGSFRRTADRIELTMTAAEVRETIAQQK